MQAGRIGMNGTDGMDGTDGMNGRHRAPAPAARRGGRAGRGAALLTGAAAALGLWSIGVPYLGPSLGFDLRVPARVEVVDHVLTGIVAATGGLMCLVLLRRDTAAESLLYPLASGFAGLAAVWMTATHVPLVVQAARGLAPWGASLWHSIPGFVLLVVTVALFLRWGGRAPETVEGREVSVEEK